MKIFISGPYTNPDPVINTRNAVLAAEKIIKKGHLPFIPHLNHLWHLVSPHDIDYWYAYDLNWLDVCDAVLRLPGDSPGADSEVEYAISKKKRIFYDIRKLPRISTNKKN
jgi:hypothetical protein